MRNKISLVLVVFLVSACKPARDSHSIGPNGNTPTTVTPTPAPTQEVPMSKSGFANVLSVRVSGNPGSYQFAVEISSPDTGCDSYTDWWEVISGDEELMYRRVLLHSHVTEQPFTRSGGPVEVLSDMLVYVRAHMNDSGYGGQALMGTVQDGFKPVELEADFASGLERIPPLPENCAF